MKESRAVSHVSERLKPRRGGKTGAILKMVSCPACGSPRIIHSGWRYDQNSPIQRYRCRDCGYRFSFRHTPLKKHSNKNVGGACQEIQLLTEEQKQTTIAQRESNTKGQIVSFAWHLKKLGRAESTIKTYSKHIKRLAKHGDLNDPESVKSVIASEYRDSNTKRLACCAYDAYLKFVGGQWIKPNYQPEHKTVFIPTDEELKLAVNSGHKQSMIYVRFLYETGARANEAARLHWTDLDRERRTVMVKASKHGNSRIISISEDLMKLLFSLPKDRETVFRKRPTNSRSSAFHNRMIRLAKIHDNPRMLKIHLHTFRHCKALREYHKTKDILHVMDVLGHRKVETTMIYVRLYKQIYKTQQPDQFITKIASTKEERIDLMSDGWDLVDKEGIDWYFRKPK
jgi:integrase/recombinase XerD